VTNVSSLLTSLLIVIIHKAWVARKSTLAPIRVGDILQGKNLKWPYWGQVMGRPCWAEQRAR